MEAENPKLRGTGRTHRAIEAIEGNAVFLVHSYAMKAHAQMIIAKTRKEGIKVLVIIDNWSLFMIKGIRLPVHCDHELWRRCPDIIRNELLAHPRFVKLDVA